MNEPDPRPTCFIAMPITTRPDEETTYRDNDHWNHVMAHLFVPAIEEAQMRPIEPKQSGTTMIHAGIIEHLENADMVLCDMSGQNPNVFFELGVRTSLDKPVAIVRDEKTPIPFDLGGMNAHLYQSDLHPWLLTAQIRALADHLLAARASCAEANPLWKQYGLTKRAQTPDSSESPTEAKLDLVLARISQLETRRDPVDDFFADSKQKKRAFQTELLKLFRDTGQRVSTETTPTSSEVTLNVYDGRLTGVQRGRVKRISEMYQIPVVIELEPGGIWPGDLDDDGNGTERN